MFSPNVYGTAAILLLSAAPTPAQQPTPIIGEFLATIGGDTSPKTVGADKNSAAPQAQPLARDAADIIGYRFFKENMGVQRPVALGRARAAFADECHAKSGRVLADDDPVTRAFRVRRVASVLPEGKPFHVWTGLATVCVGPSGHALGGFAAISESKGYGPSNHNGSTMLVGLLMPSHVRTAIYAYHPRAVVADAPAVLAQSRVASSDQEITARVQEQGRLERKRDDEFRRAIEVGTETNCGAVIQVRGPMAEVAVPPMRTTPSGQSTFWAKKTALYPPGASICTYGL